MDKVQQDKWDVVVPDGTLWNGTSETLLQHVKKSGCRKIQRKFMLSLSSSNKPALL
ncbi:hypothetical protein [Dickeya sp. ws52]|uniref:hypothetical protein n=1 Tax=Dickeya sp. ws52 TaxID=2576377 RepID=UPI0018FE26D8|nr:hypothetical protein [Dickeya sp. ws52]